MKSNLATALTFVFRDEGGYAERNTEGGGAVNRGITFTVFCAWRSTQKKPVPTWADLKAMTEDEATQIYQAQYARGISFDDLPKGIDYCVLDAAVNGGVTGAIIVLQTALGLNQPDGHFGLVTRWAVKHRDVKALINHFCDERLAKYKTFKNFNVPYKEGKAKTWGDIWTARIKIVRRRALEMVA
jgi:lysozyme family protein